MAHDLPSPLIDPKVASTRAVRTDRVAGIDVERPGGEAIRSGGEGSHRTDLDRVAREGTLEVLARCDGNLLGSSPVEQLDEPIPGDLIAETGAAGTEDAPLAIQGHQWRQGDRLAIRPLRFPVPALPRPEGERLILEGTFPPSIAHRTVQWMVDEKELQDGDLGLLHLIVRVLGEDLHPIRDRRGAGGHQLALALHLHVALPARGYRLEQGVVAETGDLDAELLGGSDDQCALGDRDFLGVDPQGHEIWTLAHPSTSPSSISSPSGRN
jgi:hypothetical protein